MPYTGDPSNKPTDEIRLIVGDVWDDIELLTDADYQFMLDRAGGSVARASVEAARAILFKIARFARERAGNIEVYGGDWFTHYKDALLAFVRNPELSFSVAMPYAGGIDREDMRKNDDDLNNVRSVFYIGMDRHGPRKTDVIDQRRGYYGVQDYTRL